MLYGRDGCHIFHPYGSIGVNDDVGKSYRSSILAIGDINNAAPENQESLYRGDSDHEELCPPKEHASAVRMNR